MPANNSIERLKPQSAGGLNKPLHQLPAYVRLKEIVQKLGHIVNLPKTEAEWEKLFDILIKNDDISTLGLDISDRTIADLKKNGFIKHPEQHTTDYLLKQIKGEVEKYVIEENRKSGKEALTAKDIPAKAGLSIVRKDRSALIPSNIDLTKTQAEALLKELRLLSKAANKTEEDVLFASKATLILGSSRLSKVFAGMRSNLAFFLANKSGKEKAEAFRKLEASFTAALSEARSIAGQLILANKESGVAQLVKRYTAALAKVETGYKRVISEAITKDIKAGLKLRPQMEDSAKTDAAGKKYLSYGVSLLLAARRLAGAGDVKRAGENYLKAQQIFERFPAYLKMVGICAGVKKALGDMDRFFGEAAFKELPGGQQQKTREFNFKVQGDLSRLLKLNARSLHETDARALASINKQIGILSSRLQEGSRALVALTSVMKARAVLEALKPDIPERIYARYSVAVKAQISNILGTGTVKPEEFVKINDLCKSLENITQAVVLGLKTADGIQKYLQSNGLPFYPAIPQNIRKGQSPSQVKDAVLQDRLNRLELWDARQNGGRLGIAGLAVRLGGLKKAYFRNANIVFLPAFMDKLKKVTQRLSLLLVVADYQRAKAAGVGIDRDRDAADILVLADKIKNGKDVPETEVRSAAGKLQNLQQAADYFAFYTQINEPRLIGRIIRQIVGNSGQAESLRREFRNGLKGIPMVQAGLKALKYLAAKGELTAEKAKAIQLDIQRRVQLLVYARLYLAQVRKARSDYGSQKTFRVINDRLGSAGREMLDAGAKNIRNLEELVEFLNSGKVRGAVVGNLTCRYSRVANRSGYYVIDMARKITGNVRRQQINVSIPKNLGAISDKAYQGLQFKYFFPIKNFSEEVYKTISFKEGWKNFWTQVFIVAVGAGVMQGIPVALGRLGSLASGSRFVASSARLTKLVSTLGEIRSGLNFAGAYLPSVANTAKAGAAVYRGVAFTAATRPLEKLFFGKTEGTFWRKAAENTAMFTAHGAFTRSVGLAGKNLTLKASAAKLGISDPVFFTSWGVMAEIAGGKPLSQISIGEHFISSLAFSLGMAAPGAVRAAMPGARKIIVSPGDPKMPRDSKAPLEGAVEGAKGLTRGTVVLKVNKKTEPAVNKTDVSQGLRTMSEFVKILTTSSTSPSTIKTGESTFRVEIAVNTEGQAKKYHFVTDQQGLNVIGKAWRIIGGIRSKEPLTFWDTAVTLQQNGNGAPSGLVFSGLPKNVLQTLRQYRILGFQAPSYIPNRQPVSPILAEPGVAQNGVTPPPLQLRVATPAFGNNVVTPAASASARRRLENRLSDPVSLPVAADTGVHKPAARMRSLGNYTTRDISHLGLKDVALAVNKHGEISSLVRDGRLLITENNGKYYVVIEGGNSNGKSIYQVSAQVKGEIIGIQAKIFSQPMQIPQRGLAPQPGAQPPAPIRARQVAPEVKVREQTRDLTRIKNGEMEGYLKQFGGLEKLYGENKIQILEQNGKWYMLIEHGNKVFPHQITPEMKGILIGKFAKISLPGKYAEND